MIVVDQYGNLDPWLRFGWMTAADIFMTADRQGASVMVVRVNNAEPMQAVPPNAQNLLAS